MSQHARRTIQGIVGLALAVALLGWGLPYFALTSWGEIRDVIATVPLSHAVGFQVLMLLGLWSYTFTFTGSLPGLSHSKALIVNLCGSSVSNLLPGGGAVGLAATYAICRSWGFSRRATSTSVVVTGVWNVLARVALPVLAIAVLWFSGVALPGALTELAAAGMVTGLAILAVLISIMASERAAQATGRALDAVIGPLLRRRQPDATMPVTELVSDLRGRINHVVSHAWWSMTLGMVGFFGAYFVLFVLIMRGTGVTLPLNLLFAAYAIGRLLTTIGITPGGIGVTEVATSVVLVGWGADPGGAAAGLVLFSVFTHLMEIPLGALGWLLWTLSPKAEPPVEAEEPFYA